MVRRTGAPHHKLTAWCCAPNLRSGDLIDTLPFKGNLNASPDGPESELNPRGPQREAGLQRERLNQDDEILRSFGPFKLQLKPTLDPA